jgi:hypothetical protein
MKCDLLSLHPLNQFLYPIKERLIRHAGRHLAVVVDLLVALNALLTPRFTRPLGRRGNANRATCATHYKVRAILFLHRVIEIWPDNIGSSRGSSGNPSRRVQGSPLRMIDPSGA